MILVFKGLRDYTDYLAKNQLHILVIDCSMITSEDIDAWYEYLIFPIGGAYCSGEQTDYITDCIIDLVAMKSFPTGEYSGFDLRWSFKADGMMRNLWNAKCNSFLTGEFDIAVMTHDERFEDEQWIAKELERVLEID